MLFLEEKYFDYYYENIQCKYPKLNPLSLELFKNRNLYMEKVKEQIFFSFIKKIICYNC